MQCFHHVFILSSCFAAIYCENNRDFANILRKSLVEGHVLGYVGLTSRGVTFGLLGCSGLDR